MRARILVLGGFLAALAGPSRAADWPQAGPVFRARIPPCDGRAAVAAGARCLRGPVPTNSRLDPTYVGSGYGLGRPSYFGDYPPLGVDLY